MIKSILEESVIKWRHIALRQRIPMGEMDCELCQLYIARCELCPVCVKTGSTNCINTPYELYNSWIPYAVDNSEIALEESEFFITLLEDY